MIHWEETETWCTQKLDHARKQNDGELSEVATAHLRGRISILKELIALPNAKRILEAQSKAVLPD